MITWSNVKAETELVLSKTMTFTDELGNHGFRSDGAASPEAVRKKIGPGLRRSTEGKLVIPAKYFVRVGTEQVSSVDLELTATSSGKFTQDFFPGGSIEAVRKLTYHITVSEGAVR